MVLCLHMAAQLNDRYEQANSSTPDKVEVANFFEKFFDAMKADIFGDAVDVSPEEAQLNLIMLGLFDEQAKGFNQIRDCIGLCRAAGYDKDRISFDSSVVRGLEYYTGMVYEAELLFPVTNEKGEEVVFGSVGGGGRYDGLVSRFRGEPVPATGFSIGVSRLMTALKNLGKLSTDIPQGPVVVCVMDRDIGALAAYQKMVQRLRAAAKEEEDKVKRGEPGIPFRAEMFQGNPKQFGKQLQYADRRNSPLCIIQGSDERAQGIVQIKDMIEGKREAAAIETNEEYKAARPGQYAVPQDRLIEEVKQRLLEQRADSQG